MSTQSRLRCKRTSTDRRSAPSAVGRARAPCARAVSAGLRVAGSQVRVDVDVAHPERPSDAHRGQFARFDDAIDRHGRDSHQIGDFLHCQEPRRGERLRHWLTPSVSPASPRGERRPLRPVLQKTSYEPVGARGPGTGRARVAAGAAARLLAAGRAAGVRPGRAALVEGHDPDRPALPRGDRQRDRVEVGERHHLEPGRRPRRRRRSGRDDQVGAGEGEQPARRRRRCCRRPSRLSPSVSTATSSIHRTRRPARSERPRSRRRVEHVGAAAAAHAATSRR